MRYDDGYDYDASDVSYDLEGYPVPIISDLAITTVTYDSSALTLTFDGVAFSELQADAGAIELSKDGGAYSTPAGTYTSWGDSQVVYTLSAALETGTYAARLTNGDNETSEPLAVAVVVSGAGNPAILYEKIYTF